MRDGLCLEENCRQTKDERKTYSQDRLVVGERKTVADAIRSRLFLQRDGLKINLEKLLKMNIRGSSIDFWSNLWFWKR